MGAGKENVSPIGGSDKREKFVAQAVVRVNKVLKAIDSVLAITDADQYMYSETDRKAIVEAIQGKLEDLDKAFINKGPVAAGFSLG